MAETVLVVVVILIVLAIAYRRITAKGRQMALLVSRGTEVTGEVVKAERVRLSRTHKACRVRYAFTTTGGTKVEREIEVLPKEFERYTEGQPVDVVYDPNDPEVNALKSAVDQVKVAMARR